MRRDPHQLALMAAAARLGVEAIALPASWGHDAVAYRALGREALVLEGRVYPELSVVADRICAHKPATKAVFTDVGVPTPAGFSFADPNAPEVVARCRAGRPAFVVKPAEGTHGDGVALGLASHAEVCAHVAAFAEPCALWLLEDLAAGDDLRLQAIGGRVAAACVRVPARVTGDGVRPLAALIAERAAEVAAKNPLNALVVDAETEALLARQGVTRDDVPERGREVILKRLANMSQGARAIDVSDTLHPRWGAYVARLSERLGLGTFALDAVTADPSRDPDLGGAWVLELNARAEWLHHTFSEGRAHDIPALVLGQILGAGHGTTATSPATSS